MSSENINVFVSYSHVDASLVAPVVKLLRVNKSLVFQDVNGIQPGKLWRKEIARALTECHMVVVFWCNHASQSEEVEKEWRAAIEKEKELLPLLLDATPLPPELVEFQWIDFRGTVGMHHSSTDWSAKDVDELKPLPPKSTRGLLISIATLTCFFWALMSFYLLIPESPPTDISPEPPSLHHSYSYRMGLLTLAIVFIVAVAAYYFARFLHRRLKKARMHPSEIEQRIASELEAEILRRAALRLDD